MTLPNATIYLVRHGETDWNAEGRLQGQKEIPLNALGRVQAEECATRLARLRPDYAQLDYLASPMRRTCETMELLRGALHLDPEGYRIDPRLVEITFGAWEGRTWREVRKSDPDRARAREVDKWGYVPPEGGESYAMLVERVRPVLADIRTDTVMVAHGGIARALLVIACDMAPQQAVRADIWQGRVLVIESNRFFWE